MLCNFEVGFPPDMSVPLTLQKYFSKKMTYTNVYASFLHYFLILSLKSIKTAAVHRRCRSRGSSKDASFFHSHALEFSTTCFDIHELAVIRIALYEQSGFRIEYLRPATNCTDAMSVTIGFVSCHD